MTDETIGQPELDDEALAKSYELANCPIAFNLHILPDDNSSEGRRILVAIRNHQNTPIVKSCRSEDFTCGVVQQLFNELLEELKADLPNRLAAAMERKRVADLQTSSDKEAGTNQDNNKQKKKSKTKTILPALEVKPEENSAPAEAEQTTLNLFG
jgi:predicted house-cleaning noncanonical NTP pyrophosphatase (MazG superfamily)